MKLQILHGDDFTGQTTRPLSEQEILELKKVNAFAGRLAIYGFPLLFLLWIFVSAPYFLPADYLINQFLLRTVAFIVIVTFAHEALHLLAAPSKIFDPNTTIFIKINGLRSNIGVRPGGNVTREQMVWIALFPFLVLTVAPWILLLSGVALDISYGLLAAMNFGLSGADLIQAVAYLKVYEPHQKIQ